MSEYISKPWDWSKNTDERWLTPCTDTPYLAERWESKGFSRFFDLGCGLGRHSVYMAKKGFSVTASDLSAYGVEHTKKWAADENVTVDTAVCDMLKLPFADSSFDCAMAYCVVQHTDTNGFIKALSELKRVLKSGGELFITLISKNTFTFQHRERYKAVDENTILLDENEAEMDVPHFYVDLDDIKRLFADWNFELQPTEWAEYNLYEPYVSKHWRLLISKK